MARKVKKINYSYAVGRRKSASARIRLYKGKGESTVNGVSAKKYFGTNSWLRPLSICDVTEKYYVTVRVEGGGKNGQLDAVMHGIAKTLVKESTESYRKLLKDAGLLTRDPRERERRKVGTGGKARRKKQSPKR